MISSYKQKPYFFFPQTPPIAMASKPTATFFACMLCMFISLPPAYSAQQNCPPPTPPYHRPSPPSSPRPHPKPPSKPHPPKHHHPKPHPHPHPPSPPHHGGVPPPKVLPPIVNPPVIVPPIIMPPPVTNPPITNPPGTRPPPCSSCPPPYTPPPGGGGGRPPAAAHCPIDALKLGLCLDVLGGLVHVGIGNPIENICCPVIQGLLEVEAAICLCTTIRLKLLNLNIFLPIALQVLATCGLTPPPGFTCPPA